MAKRTKVECPACGTNMVNKNETYYDEDFKMTLILWECPDCGNQCGTPVDEDVPEDY